MLPFGGNGKNSRTGLFPLIHSHGKRFHKNKVRDKFRCHVDRTYYIATLSIMVVLLLGKRIVL